MNNIIKLTYEELKEENRGSAHKYIVKSNKEINEEIYKNNQDIKISNPLKDWKNRSENILNNHIYDRATGDFIPATRIDRDLNKQL